MAPFWLVAGTLVALVLALLVAKRWRAPRPEPRERPVLPSHYSSLLEVDRTRYPGLCSTCGTENTPGYNYCKECGERLPGGTDRQTDTDVTQIFRE